MKGSSGSTRSPANRPAERNGFVQVADGTVEYMPAVFFERELARNGRFREVVDRFCHSFLETVIQAVACNRLHTTEERCCRWLLSVHDRIGRGRFELKVRFLARAMGVRNSEVAGILSSLEEQGLVSHDDQSITILDAIGLRRLACGCYSAMKRAYMPEPAVEKLKTDVVRASARVLRMRPGAACTLCGSSTRVPHRNGHACILALDEEIAGLDPEDAHAPQVPRAVARQSRAAVPRHPETIERTDLAFSPHVLACVLLNQDGDGCSRLK